MQKEFQRLVECGKYEAFKSNPLVLTDFEASPFYEGVREPNRSGLAPNLLGWFTVGCAGYVICPAKSEWQITLVSL